MEAKRSQHILSESKETQEQMRNKIIDIYQLEKSYKVISKGFRLQWATVTAIIHKWQKLGAVVNVPRSAWPMKKTPGVHKEVTKEPQSTSKELQASFVSVKVRIHDSTIKRRLGKNDIHGRVSRQKLLLTKMNTKICLRFTKKTPSWCSPRLLGKYSVD